MSIPVPALDPDYDAPSFGSSKSLPLRPRPKSAHTTTVSGAPTLSPISLLTALPAVPSPPKKPRPHSASTAHPRRTTVVLPTANPEVAVKSLDGPRPTSLTSAAIASSNAVNAAPGQALHRQPLPISKVSFGSSNSMIEAVYPYTAPTAPVAAQPPPPLTAWGAPQKHSGINAEGEDNDFLSSLAVGELRVEANGVVPVRSDFLGPSGFDKGSGSYKPELMTAGESGAGASRNKIPSQNFVRPDLRGLRGKKGSEDFGSTDEGPGGSGTDRSASLSARDRPSHSAAFSARDRHSEVSFGGGSGIFFCVIGWLMGLIGYST